MGNLGWYQLLTTFAKKVGGPKNLLLLASSGGYIIVRSAEAGVKTVYRLMKKDKKKDDKETTFPYSFTIDGVGDENLCFLSGDLFRVVATHDEVVLIEKQQDNNNPYFVSVNWLQTVSNYKIEKMQED